jgi:molybdate transport system regulatory protein
MKDSKFNLDGRIWIETAGEKILGHGRVELLERIQASGSIRQAALQMKMSYKQAWDLINHMNTHFTSPVVISHRGGNAIITDYGLNVISRFHYFQAKLKAFLAENSSEINL